MIIIPPNPDRTMGGRIARLLHAYPPRGYLSHGDEYGRESPVSPEEDAQRMGVLYRDPAHNPTTYPSGPTVREPEPILLGMLNFRNSPHNTSDRGWLFEMCTDHAYRDLVQQVIAMLCEKCNIHIDIVDENPAIRSARLQNQERD